MTRRKTYVTAANYFVSRGRWVKLIFAALSLTIPFGCGSEGDAGVSSKELGTGLPEASVLKVCTARFDGLTVNVSPLQSPEAVPKEACQNPPSANKATVMRQLCLNRKTLGEVALFWGDEQLSRIPIECEADPTLEVDYPLTIEGNMYVVIEDYFEKGMSNTRLHFKKQGSKMTKEVRFGAEPNQDLINSLQSGKKTKIRGKETVSYLILEADGVGTVENLESPVDEAGHVHGERKIAVIRVNMADQEVSCSEEEIRGRLFTDSLSVKGLFEEMSDQTVSFSGDGDGDGFHEVTTVTIDASTSDACNYGSWAVDADTAAQNAGIDLTQYQHRLYVLPSGANCGWAGLANVGCGSSCRVWVRTCHHPDVFAHELGHNLQLLHAATDTDNDGSVDCTYCDASDIMGYGGVGWRQLNAPFTEFMDWMISANIELVAPTPTTELTLTALEALPTSSTTPQILKVPIAGTTQHYYISSRYELTPYDVNLREMYQQKTNIHRYGGTGHTMLVATLSDGETFTDSANDLTITQMTNDGSTITIEMSYQDGAINCGRAAPELTLTPVSQETTEGVPVQYSLELVNMDDPSCAATNFSLQLSPMSCCSASYQPSSITLVPGAMGTQTITVTPNISATPENYSFTINPLSVEPIHQSVSVNGQVIITEPEPPVCTRGEPVVTLTPNSQSGVPGASLDYLLEVTNTDSNACDTTAFSFTTSLSTGFMGVFSPSILSLMPGTGGTTTLTVTSPLETTLGSKSFSASTFGFDALHEKTVSGTFVVEAPPIVDTESPEAPTNFDASANKKVVDLNWSPSTDNVGVEHYDIYRDDTYLASTPGVSFTDIPPDTRRGTSYTYYVVALDAAGNPSVSSNSDSIQMGISDGSDGDTGGGGKKACGDNKDNDGDGKCDFDGCTLGTGKNRYQADPDPECSSAQDDDETI